MDWLLYDWDLRHERVNPVYLRNLVEMDSFCLSAFKPVSLFTNYHEINFKLLISTWHKHANMKKINGNNFSVGWCGLKFKMVAPKRLIKDFLIGIKEQ